MNRLVTTVAAASVLVLALAGCTSASSAPTFPYYLGDKLSAGKQALSELLQTLAEFPLESSFR